ncbi:hypothetical protein VDG1235_3176 [Verrucomicrobiia bacterium DG1235]|nr:hypothetical protein VDG1235_3176 [Verrucomicrobiae bacterium DG1235]
MDESVANSLSGYEKGQRRLIVPGHHSPSFALITQTQEAISKGKWRLREVEYESAPAGRPTDTTAPYRWYLTS